MKRLKIALVVIVGFLLVIVILQNTENVETRILSATIVLPRAILLFVVTLFGFTLGFATAWWTRRRNGKKKVGDPATKPSASESPVADAPPA